MTLKVPPPPTLPVQFQQLNRWLIEFQSILNNEGAIDPTSVAGLIALIAEVTTLTADVATLTTEVATLTTEVATNTTNIATNTTNIATNTIAITALQANAVVRNGAGVPASGLGNNGDLYLNNTGGAGTRLYGKIAGAWVAIA
jgi:hypothetical protein